MLGGMLNEINETFRNGYCNYSSVLGNNWGSWIPTLPGCSVKGNNEMTNKSKEVKATKPATVETAEVVVEIKDQPETSFDFPKRLKPAPVTMDNVEIRPKYPIRRITDKPLLVVSGKQIELKEVELPTDYFFSNLGYRRFPNNYRFNSHFNPQEMKSVDKEPTWYGAEVNGIQFFLTNGSHVEIKWLNNDTASGTNVSDGRKPSIKIGYSSVLVESLGIRSYEETKLFNVSIEAEYLGLDNVKLADGRIRVDNSCDLTNVDLTIFNVSTARALRMVQFTGYRLSLNGFGSISIHSANCFCNDDNAFILELPTNKSVDLVISKTTLNDFKFIHYGNNLVTSINRQSKIVINKRLDYGYIVGVNPVPFVKVGKSSILVGEMLFTAVEMLGKISANALGEITPLSPWYPTPAFGSPRTLDPLVGKDTADKAYAVAFHNGSTGKTPDHQPDQIVVDIVQTTIDQIRSKVKVFALIETLEPDGDYYDDEYPF